MSSLQSEPAGREQRGAEPVAGADPNAQYIAKPVSMDVLMSAMEKLLAGPERVS